LRLFGSSFLWALPLLALTEKALGDEVKAPVSVDLANCPDVEAPEVERILGVELGAPLAPKDSKGSTLVVVQCREATASLAVDDPITKKTLQRTLDLSSFPANARSRFLAIAIAEFVSTSWTELESNPQPSVPTAGPPAPPAARKAARKIIRERRETAVAPSTPAPKPRLDAAWVVRGYLEHSPALIGGALRTSQDFSLIDWRLECVALSGQSNEVGLGTILTTVLDAGFGLGFHGRVSPFVIGGGLGVRGGVARLTGEPRTKEIHAGTFDAPWLGVFGFGRATATLVPHLSLELLVETGYTIVPVGGLVDGQRLVSVDGVWVASALGVGVPF